MINERLINDIAKIWVDNGGDPESFKLDHDKIVAAIKVKIETLKLKNECKLYQLYEQSSMHG